jgi:hypothetical protein
MDSVDKLPKRKKIDMRFGTWNVRCIGQVRSGQWRKKSQNMLDLLGVQEVRWDGGGTEPAGEYTCYYWKGNAINLYTLKITVAVVHVTSHTNISSGHTAVPLNFETQVKSIPIPVFSHILSARTTHRKHGSIVA